MKGGAKGTSESIRFAFGAQLNPEVESLEAEYLLSHLKAFIILSDWLKDQIKVDLSRRLTFFAADFPNSYIAKIFDKNYKPDTDTLIDDYLEHNPTRNRALDMLQVFSFIDEEKVREKAPDQKLRPRPCFHYRLPNSQMSRDSWDIGLEWKRWQVIEKLVKNEEIFILLSQKLVERLNTSFPTSDKDWLIDLNNSVEGLR